MNFQTFQSNSPTPQREIRFMSSPEFVGVLRQLRCSLLVSTYQAGKLMCLGAVDKGLEVRCYNFDQPMGMAIGSQFIAVGTRHQIWFLQSARQLAARLNAGGPYDACYLARRSHFTQDVHIHELAWGSSGELWFVNTRFSCLCTLHDEYSFVPRWKPQFVTDYAAEDRCHLNGLAMVGGRPIFATALAETDTPDGWRADKAHTGCLIDVNQGHSIVRHLTMPHSPRVHGGRLFVLNSGKGELVLVDPRSGSCNTVSRQPGYARGLDFAGPYAFVGLSKIRETNTFGGMPIAEQLAELKCGVAVVDLRNGRHIGHFELCAGVDEIFDVRVLPNTTRPFFSGPLSTVDGTLPVWLAAPAEAETISKSSQATAAGHTTSTPKLDRSPVAIRGFEEGMRLTEEGQYVAAIQQFEEALRHSPNFPEALCNLGVAEQYAGRFAESISHFREALDQRPEMPAAHFNLSMSLFLNGELAEAWDEYEWRWQCEAFGPRPTFPDHVAPRWQGEPLANEGLLIFGEQGIGDEIMFAACIPELADRAARCLLICEPRLAPLFQRSYPKVRVFPCDEAEAAQREFLSSQATFQIPCASVPRFVRRELAHFPRQEQFLVADPQRVLHWKRRYDALGGKLRVGISWRGGKNPIEQQRRSIPLKQWCELFAIPGIHYVNLQYGKHDAELKEVSSERLATFSELDPLRDLDEFAAAVSALDLVITIDNSAVHIAGALGVPTWALLSFPSASYWRWFGQGPETAWYRRVELMRKLETQPWADLLVQARDRLRHLIA